MRDRRFQADTCMFDLGLPDGGAMVELMLRCLEEARTASSRSQCTPATLTTVDNEVVALDAPASHRQLQPAKRERHRADRDG